MSILNKALVAIIFAFILFGCANLNYRPPIQNSVIPNPQKSYVYGRFSLNSESFNKMRLALRIENLNNGKIISLRLLNEQQVYAVEIDPGVYRVKDFIYAPFGAVMAFETKEIKLPGQPSYLNMPFTAESGKAYYLGDYFGTSRLKDFRFIEPLNAFEVTFQGGIISIQQNFVKTTDELKIVLPQLNNYEFKPAWKESLEKLQPR